MRCYHAVYSKAHNRYHILLDEVSETHVNAGELVPTLEYGLALAEALTVLHARWWGAERLSEAGISVHSASRIQNFVDISAPGVGHILGRFSSELKPHWQAILHEFYPKHPPALIKRRRDLNGFTIIHGDTGCHNILVPRHGDRPIYIIDRQPFNWCLTNWLGVYDLAMPSCSIGKLKLAGSTK
jgi:Ser/Thr protein kinase RdoA (MazF antagonist)